MSMKVRQRRPHQALRQPEENSDRYRELCEFLPWGYLVLEESGHIAEINRAAASLLGEARADLLGTPLQAHLSDTYVGLLLDSLAQASRTDLGSESHLELSARDGRIRHVELHA